MPHCSRFCLALLLGMSLSPAFAESAAPITAVVLYPGSATIARVAQVSAGMRQLEVRGVPANFDVATLRAQAGPGIDVGQITTQDISRSELASAREAALDAQITALQDRLALVEVDAKSALLVKNYLEKFSGPGSAAGMQAAVIDAKSMAGVIEAIRRGGSDALLRIARGEAQKRELSKQIDALQRELARIKNDARDVRNITVELAARQSGTLTLTYQVNGAGWQPAYRAALDSTASSIALERLASVSQNTGEDWVNVQMKLSTGQPRLSPAAPEPQAWLLTYRKALSGNATGNRPTALPAPSPAAPAPLARSGRRGLREDAAADDYVAPVIETQGAFATEFAVPAPVTLPADGRAVQVSLSRQVLPAIQRVRIVPRIERAGIVTAEAARPAGVWLAGAMQLFRDGNYVGASHWNPQASERLVFPFGRDDLIRVAVARRGEQSGSAGLLGGQAERRVADVYTVTSFHPAAIDVQLLEASPVSTSDEIRVDAAYQPPPTIARWEERPGVVGWDTRIGPQQTLTFGVDYRITYPKDGTVNGLP